MSGHCIRHWPDVEQTVGQCQAFPSKHKTFTRCCFDVGPPSPTLAQHWNSIGWMPRVCRVAGMQLIIEGQALRVRTAPVPGSGGVFSQWKRRIRSAIPITKIWRYKIIWTLGELKRWRLREDPTLAQRPPYSAYDCLLVLIKPTLQAQSEPSSKALGFSQSFFPGGGPKVVVKHRCLSRQSSGFGSRSRRFERNKNVSSPSTCESKYHGEPPWPRGSVLGLRPPGLEFRILCPEDSVISIISPSSGGYLGPVYPICAQRGPKARFISFHFSRHRPCLFSAQVQYHSHQARLF